MTRVLESRWFFIVALLPGAAIWELIGRLRVSFFVPPFSEVVTAIGDVVGSNSFREALVESGLALLIGFTIAVTLGVVVGLLMGVVEQVHWALNPYINIFMSAPKAALIPVFVMLIGFGRQAVILGIFLYSFFPVVVNTLSGVEGTRRSAVDMARSMGASRLQVIWHIVLPSAAPMILSGLRLASGRAIKGLVIGEQLIAVVGLGALLQRYGVTFQVARLYALIILIGLAGITAVNGMQLIERCLLPWANRRRDTARMAVEDATT